MDRNRILELIKIANYKYPPIICIEGASCVGKSYLIDYLKKNLKGKKILVQHNPSSSKLGLKLMEFAKNNNEISNPFLLSCFFLISQNELYEEMQKYSTLDYDLIILDRMVFFSGIVHQGYNSGEGFISCEKSLQLLALAMDFFFKIDRIFLLTDEVNTIFARRKQYNAKAYRLKHTLLMDAIQNEQECYIEFAKKINNINDKFPEPDIFDMSQTDTLENILNAVKKILQEKDIFI